MVIKNIFKKLNSYLGFISAIITIVLVFADTNIIIKQILICIVILYFFIIIGYITKTIFSTDKAEKKLNLSYYNTNTVIANKLHSFYHNLRNYTSLLNSNKNINIIDIKEKSINICNYIGEIYKELFKQYLDNKDICICLKIIKPMTIFDSDYMNWEMETFARNVSTPQDRNKKDSIPVKISENTDFQVIISDKYQDELFAFSDMTNIEEDFLKTYKIEYRNSRKYFIDCYKSCIVVPIKIEAKYVDLKIKNKIDNPNAKNFILGFLCIDSLKTFNTKEENQVFHLGIEYAKSIGDSLYLFFEKVLLLDENYNTINQRNQSRSTQNKKNSSRRNNRNGNNKKNS